MRERRKWRRGMVPMTTCRGGARFGTTYFNDMLGTTVGTWEGRASARPNSGRKYTAAALTAFGETIENESCHSPTHNSNSFYTGKPHVAGLGHVFLMRNYRASLAKWQTADPLGYPDGWNQLAYCNNLIITGVDVSGAFVTAVYSISQKKLVVYDDDTGAQVDIYNVISGDNILDHQWLANKGPLPLGQYTILDHGGGASDWYELWKDDNWFDDYTTGPNDVTRGNFRLHPGRVSLGCITMPNGDADTIAALDVISKTKTEVIHPVSVLFSKKIKYGKLTVEE